MLRRTAFGPCPVFADHLSFADGRLIKSSAWVGSCLVAVYNMHIFDIKRPQLTKMTNSMQNDILLARRGQALIIAMGDRECLAPR